MNAFTPFTPASQYAALPYRRGREGDLQILLVTSRGSGQWLIPKGKPIAGLTPSETAAREAYEEAGLLGEVSEFPIGRFGYLKDEGQKTEAFVPAVDVYPMAITSQLTLWPEMGQRQLIWFDAEQAICEIRIEALREIVSDFVRTHAAPTLP